MDPGAIIGIVLGVGMILGGNLLEGGHLHSLWGVSALMIVLGGATGAATVEFPIPYIKRALGLLKTGLLGGHHPFEETVDEIVRLAGIARKDGLLALEKEREKVHDTMLKEALKFAIDGLEPNLVQAILESRMNYRIHESNTAAKFYGQLGAYAPCVGIIGAVLGLIHVMNNLSNPEAIGPGIAVAFIATIYGVSSANLFFMPMGNRLKLIIAHEEHYYEMIRVGVKDIQQGTSPSIIASHLMAIIDKEAKEV